MIDAGERRLLFLIVAVASFVVFGWCQENFGGVTERVTDRSGAAIPEATVVLGAPNSDINDPASFGIIGLSNQHAARHSVRPEVHILASRRKPPGALLREAS